MGNLCCKETNSAPIIALSNNNNPADHKPAEKKKKEVPIQLNDFFKWIIFENIVNGLL